MRIAIVHSFYRSDNPSGENTVVQLQTDVLRRAGHQVALISRRSDEYLSNRLYPALAAVTAATGVGADPTPELIKFAPDVVHIHNLFPNWGTQWVKKWRGPIVSTLHNYRTVCASGLLWRDGADCHDCPKSGSWNSLIHSCYQDSRVATLPLAIATRSSGKHAATLTCSAKIITLNSDAHSFYKQLVGSDRVRLLPNFTEAQPSQPSGDRSGFVFVGRLTEEKGITHLLRKWPSHQRLTLIGTGPEHESIVRMYIQHPNIRVLGRLGHQETLDHLARATGLVIPSLWTEGLPTVAIEALALGTPLLLSNRISAAEQLTAGGAGFIFDVDSDRGTLARLLDSLATGTSACSIAALELHAAKYSPAQWIRSIEEIYREAAPECKD